MMIFSSSDRTRVERLGRGYAWFDAGTHDSLIEASEFVQGLEKRQGLKIGCPDEVAFTNGWMSLDQLAAEAQNYGRSSYGSYLAKIAAEYARA
jgi:glucose-1-phosphate thymidylyltransferase